MLTSLAVLAFTSTAAAVDIAVQSTGGNASIFTYGIFFEELNHAGDGGLYAELIRNRAFQGSPTFPSTLDGYAAVNGASLSLQNLSQPLSTALPTSLRVTTQSNSGKVGFQNYGWYGIDVKPQEYVGSFWAKGLRNGSFEVSIGSVLTNDTFATTSVNSPSTVDDWAQYNFTLNPTRQAPNTNNSLSITFDAANAQSLDFNLISLFPPTFNDRSNGLRPDLVQALKDLHPKFLRFPGGSNLEGVTEGDEYRWNETIGSLRNRPGRATSWGYEETGGLGIVEFFLLSQDLGVEPILAVWDGHWLNEDVVAQDQLQPYIDDILNEIEFAIGDTSTQYGALRASLGYSDPFPLKFVEIGNEDNIYGGLDSYISYRWQAYYDAISQKYPQLTPIASTVALKIQDDAIGDYHQYADANGLVSQFNYFDQNTTKPLIFNGELATKFANGLGFGNSAGLPFPNWISTVGEAVFFIGMERNGNKIIGTTYAPLFQNLNSYAWVPDLISFTADPADTVLSTSHLSLQLLGRDTIAEVLPATADFNPLYYVTGTDTDGSYIVKAAVYNSTGDFPVTVAFDGLAEGTTANLTYLTASGVEAYNDVGAPEVVNKTSVILTADDESRFTFSLPNLSIAVLKTIK
ncbi:MAG: hypothetical protein M1820_005352 [Bogoriella megaspora]|nr:MAG: hypothetical protein M1820_005352 [Bogoriella megaspora]